MYHSRQLKQVWQFLIGLQAEGHYVNIASFCIISFTHFGCEPRILTKANLIVVAQNLWREDKEISVLEVGEKP